MHRLASVALAEQAAAARRDVELVLDHLGGHRGVIARHQRTETKPEGLSNGTLNRDLAALRRAYNLAQQGTPPKLTYRPFFPMLKEAPPRRGFFEREQFEAVRRHLPADLRSVVTFTYITGWRVPSEVLPLTWAQVSFPEDVVRLEPGTTKNDEPRTFPLTVELRVLLEEQRAKTEALQRQTGQIIPWVFNRRGAPIRDFRSAWATACRLAGCPGRIPHDFRRTAIRNMVRATLAHRNPTKLLYRRSGVRHPGARGDAALRAQDAERV